MNTKTSWLIVAGLSGLIGLGFMSLLSDEEGPSEQTMAAQGFQPILELPPVKFALPFMTEVVKGLHEQHQDALIGALGALDHGSVKGRAQASSFIKTHLSSGDARTQIAMRLQLARATAGISGSGRRSFGVNAAYRGLLAGALQRLQGVSDSDKLAAINYALSTWRTAEGAKIDWSQPPFKLAFLGDSSVSKAIIERAAIADWRAGREDQGLRKYRAIANSLNGQISRVEIDLRILELSRLLAAKRSSPKVYESALIAAEKDYLDSGVLGPGNDAKAKAIGAEILNRHKIFVSRELSQKAASRATSGERRGVIVMAEKLLTQLSDKGDILAIKGKEAVLYELNKDFSHAVTTYKEMADASPKEAQRSFILSAIRVQSIPAVWPQVAPWGGTKSGPEDQRSELLSLFQRLSGLSQSASWDVAAHQGLLELTLNRRDEAFNLWDGLLKTAPSGSHARNALGTMLTAYNKEQNWAQVERLARFSLAHRLSPVDHGKSLNASDVLALALLEQGKQALAAQNFNDAVKRLGEVVVQHARFSRCDEAMFLLADAYHGANRHQEAIKTLLTFEERYPRSNFYRQAVLNGGDWSGLMAYEETAVFFYQRFAERLPKDPEAQRVRDALTELHLGLGHYADALNTLHTSISVSGDGGVRASALAKIMDIERRHGSLARAGAAAQQIIRSSDSSDDAKATALGLRASLAASQGRLAEVDSIAKQLSSMNSKAAEEALGQARYLIAAAQNNTAIKEEFNLALRDPLATLKAHYSAFVRVRQAYMSVCEAGASSYCPLAMLKLSQLALKFAESTQDINVQEDLAPEVVAKFSAERQNIMSDVTATAEKADSKALAAVNSGLGDPDTTQAVLWQTSGDWNTERVSGEGGNGFVQWSTQ